MISGRRGYSHQASSQNFAHAYLKIGRLMPLIIHPPKRTDQIHKVSDVAQTQTINVTLDDLAVDDEVVVHDRTHNAHGSRGAVYHIDLDTKLVSVITNGMVNTWEGYVDGLQKVVREAACQSSLLAS